MPGVETLRDFVNQRLTAAAEEIFGVFERTIAEYEELLCRCKEENERKQKLLDDVQLRFHRADTRQLLVHQEEVPFEQQEWSSRLEQEETEPPQIKEEEEELWSREEGLEEFKPIKVPFSPAPVRTDDDEEKLWSLGLPEIQGEGMKNEADGEDCGGPGQARNSGPDRHLNSETQDKTGVCSEAETDDSDNFPMRSQLATHMRMYQKEKPFSCSDCGEKFSQQITLNTHMVIHTGQKPFSCPECDKKFKHKSRLNSHMFVHTGKKLFSCSQCKKGFYYKSHLNRHSVIHTGEKHFSCPDCDKKFSQKCHLTSHMVIHTGEKPFSCEFCDKKFSWDSQVKKHKCTGGHTS